MYDAPGEIQLIKESLSGSKEAFGILVLQYQSLVCSITYSATGDLAKSQELAQETFLRAWKSLSQLRELEKFRSWLCRIARNVVNKSARKQRFDVVQNAIPLDKADITALSEDDPSHIAIRKEHEILVWQALKAIPENYREPMVLFYREQQSVRQVAEDLELSEDAVKQRLARGRQMLKAEVSSLVEEVLGRTTPGKAFTIAVVAALPALAPQAASAAVVTVAAKSAPVTQAAFATGLTGAILGPILGLCGGIIGSWASISNTKSPRERAFMIKLTIISAVVLFLLIGLPLVLMLTGVLPRWAYWTSFALFFIMLFPAIAWANAKQRKIQQEDGTYVNYAKCPEAIEMGSKVKLIVSIEVAIFIVILILMLVLATQKVISNDLALTIITITMAAHVIAAVPYAKWVKRNMQRIDRIQASRPQSEQTTSTAQRPVVLTKNSIYGAFGGSTIGAVAWIISISAITKDWLSAGIVVVAAAIIFVLGAKACIKDQSKKYRILISMLVALGILNLAAINIRWDYWMELYRQSSQYNSINDVSRWTLNLIISVLILALIIAMKFLDRQQRNQQLNAEM